MNRLAAVLALCLALFSIAPGCTGNAGSNKMDTQVAVSALAALAESHIRGYVNSMEALAATREVQSGDWQAIAPLLGKVAQPDTAAAVWYALPDGSYYTLAQGKMDATISDRPYFPGLMAGNTMVGDLVVSRSTNRKSVVVAVPVIKEQKAVGGLGSSIFLDDLSNALHKELGLPDDMVFYALTAGNEVALHSDTALIMAASPELSKNVKWQTSSLTGWRFALGYK